MKYKVTILPEVTGDIEQAADWYNEQQKGLGKRFYQEIKKHIGLLKKLPFGFAVKHHDIRCLQIEGFPHLIHYRADKEKGDCVCYPPYKT